MNQPQKLGIIILRIAVALQMIIHGTTRLAIGGVEGFGGFLATNHIPLGLVVAWAITISEIIGGLALAAGFFVMPLSCLFAFELLMGIALVHFKEGWFVVGAGRNGMEYSVVLIAALASTALTHFQKRNQ
jgi:putative oxidoreductase